MALLDAEQYRQQATKIQEDKLAKQDNDNGLYFNVDTAKKDFVNVFIDQGGDPFSVLGDPLRTGFKLFFHFDAQSGLLADETHFNSALAYLKRIGQTDRYELLKTFINTLSKVNSYCPWIFQSIDGLSDLYNRPFGEIYKKAELDIACLETIDWRVTSLGSMYRTIAYDYQKHVEILPVNLRRFSMSIYVYDFRNFDSSVNTNVQLLQTVKNQDIKTLNHILFDLGYCQFSTQSGGALFNTVSNKEYDNRDSNLKIDYEKSVISGLFRAITGGYELNGEEFALPEIALIGTTGLVGDNVNIRASGANGILSFPNNPKIRSASKYVVDRVPVINDIAASIDNAIDVDNWKRQLGNVTDDVERRLAQRINTELGKLFLGNAHGFDLGDLFNLAKSDSYNETFSRIYQSVSGNASLALRDKKVNSLGNING